MNKTLLKISIFFNVVLLVALISVTSNFLKVTEPEALTTQADTEAVRQMGH